MTEGDDKPKPSTPAPDRDRADALARRLVGNRSGALNRQPTGAQSPSALKNVTTPAAANPDKEAVLAARRASVQGGSIPPPQSKRTKRRLVESGTKTRPLFIGLGVLIAIVALIVAGLYVREILANRTPVGQARTGLLAWEFAVTPAQREAAFAEIDRGAPTTVINVIDLLLDGTRAERDDSKSERSFQMLAQLYLVHYAAVVKAPPPAAASDIAKKTLEGQPVPSETWASAQAAWRAWLAEQQNRGVVPKG